MISTARGLRLRLVAALAWGAGTEPVTATIGPLPGSGAFELPGARPAATRTWWEPHAGPAGVAGRLVDPGGRSRAVAIAPGAVLVPLPAPPLALAPRSDGVWSLTGDTLLAVRHGGTVAVEAPQSGLRLLAAPDDAVWVLGPARARRVARDGTVTADVAWPDPWNACLAGDRLQGWDPTRPTGLVTVRPDGSTTLGEAAVAREPFERPLAFGPDGVVSAVLGTLVVRTAGGRLALTVHGAGRTDDGRPFLAGRHDGRSRLYRPDSPPVDLADDGFVLAVHGDRALTRSQDDARWREFGPAAGPGTPADVERYGAELFPVAWLVPAPFTLVGAPDGEIIVTSSGPTGIAVLGFRWPA